MGIEGIEHLMPGPTTPEEGYTGPKPNPFMVAKDIKELLGQLAGYSSMCWEKPKDAGVFDSEGAAKAVDDAFERLNELAPLHHDDETLNIVFWAITRTGISREAAQNAITEMQNAGIYFRERRKT